VLFRSERFIRVVSRFLGPKKAINPNDFKGDMKPMKRSGNNPETGGA